MSTGAQYGTIGLEFIQSNILLGVIICFYILINKHVTELHSCTNNNFQMYQWSRLQEKQGQQSNNRLQTATGCRKQIIPEHPSCRQLRKLSRWLANQGQRSCPNRSDHEKCQGRTDRLLVAQG